MLEAMQLDYRAGLREPASLCVCEPRNMSLPLTSWAMVALDWASYLWTVSSVVCCHRVLQPQGLHG